MALALAIESSPRWLRSRCLAQRRWLTALASLLLLGGAVPSGCASAREGGFGSAVPGARLDAIEEVARRYRADHQMPDLATRASLVDCLHADDPLVRFMAIGTLTDIAGESKGYRHDAPPPTRELAIEAWVEWAKAPTARSGETAAAQETPR